MALSGTVSRKVYFKRSAAGTLSLTGDAAGLKGIFKTVAGALTLAGSVARKIYYKRSVSGSIALAGAATKKAYLKKAVSGVLNLAGDVAWKSGQWVEGILNFAGSVTRKVMFKRTVEGTLNMTGSGARTHAILHKTVSGVLTFSGGALKLATAYVKKGLNRFGFNFKED